MEKRVFFIVLATHLPKYLLYGQSYVQAGILLTELPQLRVWCFLPYLYPVLLFQQKVVA